MPRIEQTTVFKFEELSPEAQAKAIEQERNSDGYLGYDWWESIYDDFVETCQLIGVDIDRRRGSNTDWAIYFSGFSSQGDGACFEGTYRYKKGWRKALLEERPLFYVDAEGQRHEQAQNKELLDIAQALQETQAKQFYKLSAVCVQRGHYNHSGCMSVEVTHDDSMYRDIGSAEGDIRDDLRLLADWLYDRLEEEYDWLMEDDQVRESLIANEAEFTADGARF